MFTGLVEAVGLLAGIEPRGGDVRLAIRAGLLDMGDVALGDSIAVNGVCLTVVEFDASGFRADVSQETLRVTTLGALKTGATLNLEKALLPTTRLGGHLVSGHVDGIGEVLSRKSAGRAEQYHLRAPEALARYIARKGSVCVDGISLTVNAAEGAEFELTIVPHTQEQTTIGQWRPGTRVNLEIDLLARYLERLLTAGQDEAGTSTLNESLLVRAGFIPPPKV